jgi:hypothetical protein
MSQNIPSRQTKQLQKLQSQLQSILTFVSRLICRPVQKLPSGKARMHTRLDQYHVSKTNNGNGGLKWIEKGGGHYSECNKRLKG